MKIISRGALLSGAFVLVSCSGGEPSANDITKAMENAIASEISQMNAIAGGLGRSAMNMNKMLKTEISNLEKMSCTENAKDSYTCNIRFRVVSGMIGAQPREQATSIHMMRTGKGWMVAK